MKVARSIRVFASALALSGPFWARTAPALESANVSSDVSLQQQVDRGVAAYEAGQFEVAVRWLQQALAQQPPRAQRAALLYNLGACLLQLQRPGEAEVYFADAAALSRGQDEAIARLQAGLAAFAAGHRDRAERHYRAVTVLGEQSRPLAAALREQLQGGQPQGDRTSGVQARLELGYQRLSEQRLEQAEEYFLQVREAPSADPLRADAVYGLALVAERRRQWRQASVLAERAIELDPSRWESLWLLGSLHRQLGDLASAADCWTRALQFDLPEATRRQILKAYAALDPRPPSGSFGHLQWGLGSDSNATQAGAASGLRLSNAAATQQLPAQRSQAVPSGQAQVSLSLGHLHRIRRTWLLQTVVHAAHWALLRSSVAPASVGQADLAVEIRRWLTPSFEFGGRLSGGHSRTGLWGSTPFASFASLAGEGQWHPSSGWHSRVEAEYQVLTGHDNLSAVGGDRFRAGFEQSFGDALAQWGLRLSGQVYRAGKQAVVSDPQVLPRCARANSIVAASCAFEVPLSFREVSGTLFGAYDAVFDLSVRGQLRVEGRDFWQPSQLLVGAEARPWPGSEKRRQDVGIGGLLELDWSPPALDPASVWLQYQGRKVTSNLKPDREDPQHRFDYEDRNYTQHSWLLGARLDWN